MALPVPVYVINLDRSADRLTRMQEQADRIGFTFTRIAAVRGMRVPVDLQHYFLHIRTRRRPIIEKGAIGCYASHLKTWKEIEASEAGAALVLEDDALLADDMPRILEQALAALPAGWDFLHLSRPPRRAFRPIALLPCGRSLVRYTKIPAGTLGYLISRPGATKLLDPSIPRFWSVDVDTRRPWIFGLDVYGMVPAPIDTESFETTIRIGRKRSPRRGLPRPTKFSWSNTPLNTPGSLVYYVRALGLGWWLRCLGRNLAAKIGIG